MEDKEKERKRSDRDLEEVIRRVQHKLTTYKNKDNQTNYTKGMIDGLDFALFEVEMLEIDMQGQQGKQKEQ